MVVNNAEVKMDLISSIWFLYRGSRIEARIIHFCFYAQCLWRLYDMPNSDDRSPPHPNAL